MHLLVSLVLPRFMPIFSEKLLIAFPLPLKSDLIWVKMWSSYQ